MLVKKLHESWQPQESPGLLVGETIEITDPRQLILDKKCVALGEDGQELDSFDLYGVVDQDLVQELKTYKAGQHQEQIRVELESEKEELTDELSKIKTRNAKDKKILELDQTDWKELRKMAIAAGVFKPKMNKKQTIEALIIQMHLDK